MTTDTGEFRKSLHLGNRIVDAARLKPVRLPPLQFGAFAIFYLMAQFIERVIEPFSEVDVTSHLRRKKDAGSLHLFGIPDMIKDLMKSTNLKALGVEKTRRSISMWGLASFTGMILCYATIGLFQVLGVQFVDISVILSRSITGHTIDVILSGVVVGAGTKPLHDVIDYISKKKDS